MQKKRHVGEEKNRQQPSLLCATVDGATVACHGTGSGYDNGCLTARVHRWPSKALLVLCMHCHPLPTVLVASQGGSCAAQAPHGEERWWCLYTARVVCGLSTAKTNARWHVLPQPCWCNVALKSNQFIEHKSVTIDHVVLNQ